MFAPHGPTFLELTRQALASTREGYDLLAPKFDLTPFRTPDEILEPAIRAIGPVDSALDLCCGTGAAMHLLKPLCRTELAGVDFSPGMLRIAEKNLAGIEGSAKVTFVEADVLQMNFASRFDLATCFGALGHIRTRDETLFVRNIRRALKPGGRFVFVTAPHPRLFSLGSVLSRTFNAVMRVRNALLRPPFIMYYLTFLLPESQRLLESEGFSVTVRTGLFPKPFQHNCLVIATNIFGT